jgi:hypothetical protein
LQDSPTLIAEARHRRVDRVFMKKDLSHKGPGYVFGQTSVIAVKTAASQLAEVLAYFWVPKSAKSLIDEGGMPWS